MDLDLGIIVEGIVELDPISGRFLVRVEDERGEFGDVDVQAQMEKYKGEPVRFILTPLQTVSDIAKMVEEGELDPSQIPTLKPH